MVVAMAVEMVVEMEGRIAASSAVKRNQPVT
jgi:hypothetical protein